MPIYEYMTDHCQRQPPCAGRREYIQGVSAEPLRVCRDCTNFDFSYEHNSGSGIAKNALSLGSVFIIKKEILDRKSVV